MPATEAVCSVHDKVRTVENLEYDPATKEYECLSDSECRVAGNGRQSKKRNGRSSAGKGGSRMCSVHNKKRTMQNLVKGRNGRFSCTDDSECQGGANEEEQPDGEWCSIHGKRRSWDSLEDDDEGGYKCVRGEKCKGKSGRNASMPPRKRHGYEGGDGSVECSTHGKLRTKQNMRKVRGGWKCVAGEKCQGTTNTSNHESGSFECSEHGKVRSARSLEDDGEGGYACMDGMTCK